MRLFVFLTLFSSLLPAYANQLVGHATDLSTGKPIYTETHHFTELDGRAALLTEYRNVDQTLLAKREVLYQGNRVARYTLASADQSYAESVHRQVDGLIFKIAENGEVSERSVPFENAEDIVIDAGFNNFIVANWQALMEGDQVIFDFASTARRDAVGLKIRLVEAHSNEQIATIKMTPANPIFRLFVKPVLIGFYRDTRQLASYEGISNLRDPDGRAYRVRITFAAGQHSPNLNLH